MMKKILSGLCCILIALGLCSCGRNNPEPPPELETTMEQASTPPTDGLGNQSLEMEHMPEPFDHGKGHISGEDLDAYRLPYRQDFYSIDGTLIQAVGLEAFEEWRLTFKNAGGTRPDAEHTIVEFVKEFDLSKERLQQYVNDNIEWAKKTGNDSPSPIFSDEAMEAIYGTQKEIDQCFVSEYSILQHNTIYTPEWLYTHSVEEYKEEGLNPQQVRNRISLYENIPFSEEAREAFSEKLQAFTGQGLETEAPISQGETTPAPPKSTSMETISPSQNSGS